MDVHTLEKPSLRDELRLHSRFIRDTLAPTVSRQTELSRSDSALLHSILKKLEFTQMTLDFLRYSRIEKALMVIAASGSGAVWILLRSNISFELGRLILGDYSGQ